MKLRQVPNGARFYWRGNKAQTGSYCLKCTWLVVYHLASGRFAVLGPWTAVQDVETEHDDTLPSDERIQKAHQQAVGLLLFLLIFLIALAALFSLWL